MLGSLDSTQKEVTVIGGGVAGLLMAYRLDQLGYEVTLYEAQPRLGGLIKTEKTPFGIAENAAHSFLATGSVLKLCEELGVKLSEVLPNSKARFILRKGQFRRFPLGIIETIKVFLKACFKKALDEKITEKYSMAEWARYFLGESALRYLIEPFVRGIYGARPEELSIKAAFPGLLIPKGSTFLSYQWKKRFHKNPIKNPQEEAPKVRAKMMSPVEGMESLVIALERRLKDRLGERLRIHQKLESLPQSANLILTVPAEVASELLKREEPGLSKKLSQVQYTPLICVTVFINRKTMARVPRGIGILMPADEGSSCLGILFNSSSFPQRVVDPEHCVSCTVILGGTSSPEFLNFSDEKIREIVQEELRFRFGHELEILDYVIRRWKKAVPRYDGFLMEVWEAAKHSWCSRPGHILFGNYTGQVSLRGMIETIRELKE